MNSYQKLKARTSALEKENKRLRFIAKRFQATLPSTSCLNYYNKLFEEFGFITAISDTYDHQATLDRVFKERQRQYQMDS